MSEADLSACLAYLEQPDDFSASMRLSNVLGRRGAPIADDLHERTLRSLLVEFPYRADLTRTLVQLICNGDRDPIPDLPPRAAQGPDDLSVLVERSRAAASESDTVGLYAFLWQAVLQHPGSAAGWCEMTLALAERRRWGGARLCAARALTHSGLTEKPAARSLTVALNMLAENRELADLPWRTWVDTVPDAWQNWPEAVSLRLLAGDTTVGPRVERMVRAFGGEVTTCFVAALEAYKRSDFPAHNGWIRRAFEIDADDALWQTVGKYSGQIAGTLSATGEADAFADWLSERPVNTLISSDRSPESIRQAVDLRRVAMERGLPSPLFVAQGKSGSASVANIFNSGFGLPTAVFSLVTERVVSPWLADYRRGGACYVTHLKPSPTNVALLAKGGVGRVIAHVRDPRQILISHYEHFRRYPTQSTHAVLRRYDDPEALLDATIEHILPEVIHWTAGWLQARTSLAVEFTTFEDFVQDRDAFTDRLVALYGGDPRHFDRAAASTEHAGLDFHRRLGSTDEWRTRLNPKQIETVNRMMPDQFWAEFMWVP